MLWGVHVCGCLCMGVGGAVPLYLAAEPFISGVTSTFDGSDWVIKESLMSHYVTWQVHG